MHRQLQLAQFLRCHLTHPLGPGQVSRDFETETDDYAHHFLKSQHISPPHLARLLQRLADLEGDKESPVIGFLSFQPLTEEPIKKLKD